MKSSIASATFLRPQRNVAGVLARTAAVLAALFLAACAGRDDDFSLEPARPSAEIYNEGLAFVEAGRYRDAIASFEELDRFYPYSNDARRGTVLTALSAYELNDFDLAIAARWLASR